ncbi:MAG: hypothetical protein RL150_172 [Candidatus Parcubacteria bacterium]|jgi:uncharacterized SAM-binding protein YcdF (DUF218 family)
MTNLKELETVVSYLGVGDTPQPADVIFVVGHYLKEVPYHAAELFKAGIAPTVLITGRKTRYIPADVPNEAQYFKQLMVEQGVSEEAIVLEEQSVNTLEDVQMGMETLRAHGIAPSRIVLVAYTPLLRRAKATFAKQFPEVEVLAVPYPITDLEDAFWLQDRLTRMLLEFDRLTEFAEKGDIAHVDVPANVLEAAAHIKANLPKPPTTQLI